MPPTSPPRPRNVNPWPKGEIVSGPKTLGPVSESGWTWKTLRGSDPGRPPGGEEGLWSHTLSHVLESGLIRRAQEGATKFISKLTCLHHCKAVSSTSVNLHWCEPRCAGQLCEKEANEGRKFRSFFFKEQSTAIGHTCAFPVESLHWP